MNHLSPLPLWSFLCVLLSISSGCSWVGTAVGWYQTTQNKNNTEAALADFAKKNGYELRRFDLNRDDDPDIFKFYRVEFAEDGSLTVEDLVRKDVDINHDGLIDVSRFFDEYQQLTEERSDLDFDGRVDTVGYYEGGALARKEIDINYDGVADVVKRYKGGALYVIEADQKGDGKIDTWEYYEKDKLDRIGRDTDGDGSVDFWNRANPSLAEEDELVEEDVQASDPEGSDDAATSGDAEALETPEELEAVEDSGDSEDSEDSEEE